MRFNVYMTITGHANATVEAKDEDEARAKAEKYDFVDASEDLVEWEYADITDIESESTDSQPVSQEKE